MILILKEVVSYLLKVSELIFSLWFRQEQISFFYVFDLNKKVSCEIFCEKLQR